MKNRFPGAGYVSYEFFIVDIVKEKLTIFQECGKFLLASASVNKDLLLAT
jgi:hypothetical protein